jgi:hypothetical protein
MNRVAVSAGGMSSAFATAAHAGAASMASIGASVAGAMDHMAMLAAGAATAGAAVAGAFAFHAVHEGLTKVNASVENSKIGFASLFNMFGAVPDIQGGLGMAATLMAGIRKDAAALPGETQDFVSMAQVLTGPILQAGKGVKEIRDLTRDTVVSAAALSVPFEVASREMGMMLAGTVSSHMPLAAKLGINAHTMVGSKTFHDASTAERFDFIEDKLKKAKDALPLFEHSWAGLTSTMADKWHMFLGKATEPLFSGIKGSMIRGLTWLDAHQQKVDEIADSVGHKLGQAWNYVDGLAYRIPGWIRWASDEWDAWSPKVVAFGHELEHAFAKAWPWIEKIGGYLEEKLKNPGETIKQLAMLRLGAGAAQMLPGMLQAGASAKSIFTSAAGAGSSSTEAAAQIAKGVGDGIKNVSDYGIKGGAEHEANIAAFLTSPHQWSGPGGGGLFDALAPVGAGAGMTAGAEPVALGFSGLIAELGPLVIAAAAATVALGMVAGAAHLATIDPSKETGLLAAEANVFTFVMHNTKYQAIELGGQFVRLGTSLWHAVEPLVDILGVGLMGAVDLVVIALRVLIWPLEKLAGAVEWIVDKIPGYHHSSQADKDAEKHRDAANSDAERWAEAENARTGADKHDPSRAMANGVVGTALAGAGDWGLGTPLLPGQRSANERSMLEQEQKSVHGPPTNVFNGAKFEIKLDARNESPDRVVRRVFDAVGRDVSKRTVSAAAPPRSF